VAKLIASDTIKNSVQGKIMKLREYLDKYGTPVSVLARRCDICISTMHKILAGVEPGLRVALAIQDATEGAVKLKDLLRPKGEVSPQNPKLRQRLREEKAEKERDDAKKKKPKKAKTED